MKNVCVQLSVWVFLFVGCQSGPKTGSEASSPSTTVAEHAEFGFWYAGSVEGAFELAKSQDKPVFLYWGAVWCPPCNELKDQIFSKQEFKDTLKNAVPVYLDGDLEEAQVWGDKFEISGYPTTILLTADKQEIMRFTIGMDITSYKETLTDAINDSTPIETLLDRAKTDSVAQSDWKRISSYAWNQAPGKEIDVALKLKGVLDKFPKELTQELSAVKAKLLAIYVYLEDEEKKQFDDNLMKELFEQVLADKPHYVQNRSFFFYYAKSGADHFYKDKKKHTARIKRSVLKAVSQIRQEEKVSDLDKMLSYYPEISFATTKKGLSLSKIRTAQIKLMIYRYEKAAVSKFERKALVSSAAWLLEKLKDIEAAEKLLLKEIQDTDTPYYYQSQLAGIFKRADQPQKALAFSAAAKNSANGRATRLQWRASELMLNLDLHPKNVNNEKLKTLIREYFDMAYQLRDGFQGRNLGRMKRIAKKIKDKEESDKDLLMVYNEFSNKCNSLPSEQQSCKNHFDPETN